MTKVGHPSHNRFYFCDQPHGEYAHVIFGAAGQSPAARNRSLWNVESIQSMCRLDELMRSSPLFPAICQQPAHQHQQQPVTGQPQLQQQQCCPSWTLGHYVALMRNRSTCAHLDADDVTAAFNILQACSRHYHGLQLSPNCDAIVQEGIEYSSSTRVVYILHVHCGHRRRPTIVCDFVVDPRGWASSPFLCR